jgi:DNA-binding transcriptional ArsR family regulator
MTTPEDAILALGDRNRLGLLRLLLERPLTVTDLTGVTGLGQSLVSHHLAALVRGGWIAARRDGRRSLYSVQAEGTALAPLARWIRSRVPLPEAWGPLPEQARPAPAPAGGEMEDYLL